MYDAIWAMRWNASLSARAATLVVIFGLPVAGWSYLKCRRPVTGTHSVVVGVQLCGELEGNHVNARERA